METVADILEWIDDLRNDLGGVMNAIEAGRLSEARDEAWYFDERAREIYSAIARAELASRKPPAPKGE